MRRLLMATRNPGKAREYAELLADLPLSVTTLDAEGVTANVEESGQTFQENARLKATTYARLTGLWTWADDSGLEVDALDGRPGVWSARYGGPAATDRDRYLTLLDELRRNPERPRTARFRCVVALALAPGQVLTAEGVLAGVIAEEPRGAHGFGYDPVFFVPAQNGTLAELPPSIKNRISHRAVAAAAAKQLLVDLLAQNRTPG